MNSPIADRTLRTPDERFSGLPDYNFAPHYVEDLVGYEGLRVHYLDEGPAHSREVFLCLHGQPTWAYLYRKMIPVFTAAGHRSLAPDFLGFGRSDKPLDDTAYTFNFHREFLMRFIESLNLTNITLVCQDWGGLLGLTIPMDMPDRFARLLVMNTALPTGAAPGQGFMDWRDFVAAHPNFDIARMIRRSDPQITEAEAAAHNAPFPDRLSRAGVRRFPAIVPISPEMEGADLGRRAARWWSEVWTGKTFMAVGMNDPVLGPSVMAELCKVIQGCPAPLEVAEGGHFLQERGGEIARAALKAFE